MREPPIGEMMTPTKIRDRFKRVKGGPTAILGIALVPAVLIVALLGTVFVVALTQPVLTGGFTLQHFEKLFASEAAFVTARNTLVFALITTAIAMVIGVPCAWLVERTDLKAKSVVSIVMILGVLLPGFIVAMGWLLMFDPKIGLFNTALAELTGGVPVFDVVSIPGMALVQGLSLAPVAFAMTSSSFRSMDSSLEEAARASGANFGKQMLRITLPLSWPSILAAGLYVVIVAVATFDIPAVIGLSNRIFTFSTFLYFEINPTGGLPRYGIAAAFSTIMIVMGVVLSWVYGRVLRKGNRYRVVTGKNYRPSMIRLGKWQVGAWILLIAYFLLSKGIPLLLLVWTALIPRIQMPSLEAFANVSLANFVDIRWDLVGRAAVNTGTLVLFVPLIALILSTALSWIVVRSKFKRRAFFDYAAFMPHAVPNLIFGMAAMLLALFVLRSAVPLYGTIWLLIIVMALVQISFASRMVNSGLLQIHPELEEAAEASGAGTFTTLRRVVLPLLRGTFVQAWVWLAILAFRELTLPVILFSSENVTLSFVIWNFWQGGLKGVSAATTVILLIVMIPFAVAYFRLTKRSQSHL